METNFGTATPRQRYALFCITKKDYRKVELSKEYASKMIADLQTEQKENGSQKVRKQTVKTVEIFMDKDQMREEFLQVWGKDAKMVEWSVKNHSGFKLLEGKVIMLDKPNIETHFCFGWSTCGQGPEWEEACKTHDNFWNNQAEWFATENIQKFDREFPLPDLDDICVLEAAEYMEDCVSLPDVCEELVAESFTLAGSLHETCDVHDFYCCRNHSLRVAEALENLESLVRNVCRTYVWINCAEREVCALSLSGAHAVEQC